MTAPGVQQPTFALRPTVCDAGVLTTFTMVGFDPSKSETLIFVVKNKTTLTIPTSKQFRIQFSTPGTYTVVLSRHNAPVATIEVKNELPPPSQETIDQATWACLQAQTKHLLRVIRSRRSLDAFTLNGLSCLHLAAMSNSDDCCVALIGAGMRRDTVDSDNVTAKAFAAQHNFGDRWFWAQHVSSAALTEVYSKCGELDLDGDTNPPPLPAPARLLLDLACARGELDKVKELWPTQRDAIQQTQTPVDTMFTPLQIAALFGHAHVCTYLVENGAVTHATPKPRRSKRLRTEDAETLPKRRQLMHPRDLWRKNPIDDVWDKLRVIAPKTERSLKIYKPSKGMLNTLRVETAPPKCSKS